MSGRATGAQRSSNERAFADFFSRCAGRLCGLYVGLDAVRTLRRESDSQRDELAILPWNRAAIAAHDLVEREPCIELSGSKFAHLLQKPQITGIMVVLTHSYPPDCRIHVCAARSCAHEHNACLTTKGHALREARPFNLGGLEQSSSGCESGLRHRPGARGLLRAGIVAARRFQLGSDRGLDFHGRQDLLQPSEYSFAVHRSDSVFGAVSFHSKQELVAGTVLEQV